MQILEAHKEDSWSLVILTLISAVSISMLLQVKYFQSKIEFLASGEQKVIGDLATS